MWIRSNQPPGSWTVTWSLTILFYFQTISQIYSSLDRHTDNTTRPIRNAPKKSKSGQNRDYFYVVLDPGKMPYSRIGAVPIAAPKTRTNGLSSSWNIPDFVSRVIPGISFGTFWESNFGQNAKWPFWDPGMFPKTRFWLVRIYLARSGFLASSIRQVSSFLSTLLV